MNPATIGILVTLMVFVLGVELRNMKLSEGNHVEIKNIKSEIKNGFPDWCPLQSFKIKETEEGYILVEEEP